MSAVSTARNVRIAIWTIFAVLLATGVIWYAVVSANKPAPAAPEAIDVQLVRDNSHRVTNPASEKGQLVEFLDFECESCRAAEPLVQELKKQEYGTGSPSSTATSLPVHANSGTDALAVEAAAQQGKYEDMATTLFETQPQWGEKQDSQAGLFRAYAKELGLDLTQYDADVAAGNKGTDPARTSPTAKHSASPAPPPSSLTDRS